MHKEDSYLTKSNPGNHCLHLFVKRDYYKKHEEAYDLLYCPIEASVLLKVSQLEGKSLTQARYHSYLKTEPVVKENYFL